MIQCRFAETALATADQFGRRPGSSLSVSRLCDRLRISTYAAVRAFTTINTREAVLRSNTTPILERCSVVADLGAASALELRIPSVSLTTLIGAHDSDPGWAHRGTKEL